MLRRASFVGLALALVATLLLPGDALSMSSRSKSVFVYTSKTDGGAEMRGFRWEKDGTLTPVAGSPFAVPLGDGFCGGFCQTLGYSKKRKALIVSGIDGLHVMQVAKDGTLSAAGGSPLVIDGVSNSLLGTAAVDRGRRTFVYSCDFGANGVRGFEMAKDGALTELAGSPFAAGEGPDGLIASKKHVFCVNEIDETISAFAVEKDGSLTAAPGGPVSIDTGFSWNVHLGPKGKRIYCGDDSNNRLFGFDFHRKTGELTALPGSPFTTDIDSSGPGLSAAKRGPAVIVSDGHGIQSALVARDGTVTPLAETVVTAVNDANAHGRSPNGKFIAIAGAGPEGAGLYSYAVDRKTGVLTFVDFEAYATGDVTGLQVVKR